MNDAMHLLKNIYTLELVRLHKKQMVFGCKRIFNNKEDIKGIEEQIFKARLVENELTQVEGTGYNEIFSFV